MKVYIVVSGYYRDLDRVFSTLEKAQDWLATQVQTVNTGYEIQEWTVDTDGEPQVFEPK